jgi:hypothetical protein
MLKNTIAKTLLQLILLPATFCMAQQNYTTTYSEGRMDLTPYAATKNLWKLLDGSGVCAPNSINASTSGAIACLGINDNTPYVYSISGHAFTPQTAMGAVQALAYRDSSNVWALKTTTYCSGYGLYGVFKWNGSAWTQPTSTSCLSTLVIGADNALIGIAHGSPSGDEIFLSTDSDQTWTPLGGGWTNVSIYNASIACAVKSGHLYVLDPSSNTFALLPGQPSGTTAGCLDTPGSGSAANVLLATWDTLGHVHLYDSTAGKWGTVFGLTVGSIASGAKKFTYALDTGGHPYHLNFSTKTWQGQTTGTWSSGCPSPAFPCQNIQPPPTHTITLKVAFPHSVYSGTQQQSTIAWNANANVVSVDANPQCDMLMNPNDAECSPTITGSEICNASHAQLGAPGQIMTLQEGMSHDYEDWYGEDASGTFGPTPSAAGWYGQVTSLTREACVFGIPTCANYEVLSWYINSSQIAVQYLMDNTWRRSPWLIEVPYATSPSWGTECFYGDQIAIPTFGEIPGGCD